MHDDVGAQLLATERGPDQGLRIAPQELHRQRPLLGVVRRHVAGVRRVHQDGEGVDLLRRRLQLGAGWTPAMEDSRAFSYDTSRRMALFAFTSYDPEGRGISAPGALGVRVSADGHLSEVGRMPVHPTAPITWPDASLITTAPVCGSSQTTFPV